MSVLAGSDVFGSLTITLPLLSSIAIRPFAFSTASAKRSSSVTTNCFSKSLLMANHGHSSILLFLTPSVSLYQRHGSGRCEKWDACPRRVLNGYETQFANRLITATMNPGPVAIVYAEASQ